MTPTLPMPRRYGLQPGPRLPCRLSATLAVLLTGCLLGAAERSARPLEPIRISADGRRFVGADSGTPFQPWGVNYDHDSRGNGRLLEDYWEEEWETVRQDFQEIQELGANLVRVHLQFGRFMDSATSPNERALRRLKQLVDLAAEKGLYLDLTGLGCYHKSDVPDWYDRLDEAARWSAQAEFWRAVARTGRGQAAVFCYDLMNEPVIGGDVSEGWLGGELGGKYFVQRLTLKPNGRTNLEIAGAWVAKLTSAIRAEDPDHLITVGVIPWAMVWPTAKPVFYAPEVATHLDFVSAHFYPKSGEVDKALTALAVYDLGKPLVIEELFPLNCSLADMDRFLEGSREIAEGWISFYWGKTIGEYEASAEPVLADALVAGWLKYFREKAPTMRLP